MKYLFASDIHGSAYYCRKLLEAYRQSGAGRLILLGDLLYHGPRNDLPKEYAPKEVIAMLNGYKQEICTVRGNCEAEVDQMVLEFPVLSEFGVVFADELTLYMLHGHKNLDLPVLPGDILLCGHTHVPAVRKDGEHYYVNPGSVSIPKEGSCHGYMMLENRQLRHVSLEGENTLPDFTF